MTTAAVPSDELLPPEDGIFAHANDRCWTITIQRRAALNSITEPMYAELAHVLTAIGSDARRLPIMIRGAGRSAFSAGTDIGYMARIATTAGSGVRYERKLTAIVSQLENLDVPTVAVIDGHCLGGGLLIAAACDLRIATPRSRFAVPIARTLGNCLSAHSLRLLSDHLGVARTLDLVLRSRTFDARQMHATGFLSDVIEDDHLDEKVVDLVDSLHAAAPLTVWATKELVRRSRTSFSSSDDADILERVYGSRDFAEGSRAFLSGNPPAWSGA